MHQSTPTQQPEVANIQDQQLSTNQQAVPVPAVWGTRKVALTWIAPILNIYTYDIESDQKKGGNQKGYGGGLAGAFGFGQHHSLIGIIKDGKSIWPIAGVWALGHTIDHTKLYLYNAVVWRSLDGANYTSTTDNAPDGINGAAHWTEYEFVASGDFDTINTVFGAVTIFWGTPTQTVPALLQSTGNTLKQAHPDYKNVGYVAAPKFVFGSGRPSSPDLGVVIRRAPQQTVVTGGPAGLTDGQANIAAVIAEILTGENFLGVDASMVDATSFQTTANLLQAQASITGVSPLLDTQRPFRDVMQDLLDTVDAYLRFNPSTKQIELGLYAHGAPPAAYTTLNIKDLAAPLKMKPVAWSKAVSRCAINYADRAFAFSTVSESATSPALYTAIGEVRTQSIDRPMVTRRAQARALAAEWLRSYGKPPQTGTVSVRREKGWACRPGSYVQLPVQLEPNDANVFKFFRVTKRTIPKDGPMTLEVQGENGLAPVPYTPGVPAILGIDDSVPAVPNARIVEVPSQLTGAVGEVIALAERPDTVTKGFDVYFDTNTGSYNKLGTMGGWAMLGVLRTGVLTTDTTIDITVSAQADTSLAGISPGALAANDDSLLCVLIQTDLSGQICEDAFGFPIYEVCSISAQTLVSGSDYNLTVLRGRRGTSKKAFSVDGTGISGAGPAEVWIIERDFVTGFYHPDFDTLRQNRVDGDTPEYGQFRLVPFNQISQRDLSDCADIPFYFAVGSASGPQISVYFESANSPGGTNPDIHQPALIQVDLSSYVTGGYPVALRFGVSATAPAGSPKIVSAALYFRNAGDTQDTLLEAKTFNPSVIYVGVAGLYRILTAYIRARSGLGNVLTVEVTDEKGNTSVRQVHFSTISLGGSGGSGGGSPPPPQVGPPTWTYNGTALGATETTSFGTIVAQPSCDGCTTYWRSRFSVDGTTWSAWSGWTDQSATPAVHNLLGLAGDSANHAMLQEFQAYSTLAGASDSDPTTVQFIDFTPVTG